MAQDRQSMLCAYGQHTIIVIELLYQEINVLSDVCLIVSESLTTIVYIQIFIRNVCLFVLRLIKYV